MMPSEIAAPKQIQIQTERVRIESLNRQFATLYCHWCSLINDCDERSIYKRVCSNSLNGSSIGEMILRSAAAVEQTCGGLTANLWDDPFEWTLPEALPSSVSIIGYLEEVDATRRRAFSSLRSDADLSREISLPTGEMTKLSDLLTRTLVTATGFYDRAFAMK